MRMDFYDLETNSPKPKNCEPCQVAVMTVDMSEDGGYDLIEEGSLYLKIKANRMAEGAYNVHGISKEKTEAEGYNSREVIPHIGPVVAGYNNQRFDDIIIERYGASIEKSIDLFKGTRRLKSRGLLSKANLGTAYRELVGEEPKNAHDALADVRMTIALVKPMMGALDIDSFSELVTWLSQPQIDTRMTMPFGKHKGVKLEDLPLDYVLWMRHNLDLTGDLKASLEAL